MPAGASEDKTRQLFQIVPTTGPTDEATTETPQDDPRRDGDEESTR